MNDSIPLKESSFDPGLIDCLRRVADDPTSYPELDGLLRNAADTLADMYATPEGGWFAAWQAADHDRANLQRRIAESEWHPPAPPRCEANHKTAMAEIARANNGAISEEQSKVETLRDSMRLDAQTMAAKDRKIEDLEQIVASYALTWSATDGYDPERPKDGETVLGWWPANLPGYRGGMESVTFGAADEDGRSDTWTNAFGDSTDAPDYWARVKGPK